MTARVGAFSLALLLFSSACASGRSTYVPEATSPGELRWAYADGLRLSRDGVDIGSDSWDGLPEAVACVPAAHELASTARSERVSGTVFEVLAMSSLIGGSAAGIGLLAAGEDHYIEAIAVSVGGLAFGTFAAMLSSAGYEFGQVHGIDAVNMYNDEHRRTEGCPGYAAPVETSRLPALPRTTSTSSSAGRRIFRAAPDQRY